MGGLCSLGPGLPVDALFDYLNDGLSLDYFLESFPSVARAAAETVQRYGQNRIMAELRV